ncbi:hypothetical protein QTQ03_20120 [Micromonospora sp. WMMA1363]|uniref:hypothetical protein n=1 Tax=Micromonospora sp. WMMA1363 TaxID=3053985 RepID=UPI00259D2D73|nr:hypothetical protein [Micromonospora sp. WMMA1363]MDM4721787.1 hypothetical protein [Micromonospora sp. WMMA1363]
MSEHDVTLNLDDIFDAYTAGGPLVVPPGAAAAQRVASRRRTARFVAAGVLVGALVAAPALAATWTDPEPPVPPANTASPTPPALTTAPTASPSPGATTASTPAPPDGWISEDPRITDLSVSGDDVRLTVVDADRAVGNLRLTIRNLGPQRAADPQVRVYLPAMVTASSLPGGCAGSVAQDRSTAVTCRLAILAVEDSVMLDLTVSVRSSEVGTGAVGEYSAVVSWNESQGATDPEPRGAYENSRATGVLTLSE